MNKEDLKDFRQAGTDAGELYLKFNEGFGEGLANTMEEGECINPKGMQSIREIIRETFLIHYQERIDNNAGCMDETVLIDTPPAAQKEKCKECQCNECDNLEDCVGRVFAPSTGRIGEIYVDPCAECDKAGWEYAPVPKLGRRCTRFEPRRI